MKSPDSTTDSAGCTSATFHVCGMEGFSVSVRYADLKSKETIDIRTGVAYLSSFKAAQYITVKESDYSGGKIPVSDLTDKYESVFLDNVKI